MRWMVHRRTAGMRGGGPGCMLLVALCLLSCGWVRAQVARDPRVQSTLTRAQAAERAGESAQALQRYWQTTAASGGPTWDGINAWQRFVIVDGLVQYTELSGDRAYVPQVERAVVNRDGLDGNDDDLWAVLASLHVYRVSHSGALLLFSKAKFAELTERYWDGTCGGGMWWDHARTYKNAITNELLLRAATELYRTTRDPVYLVWARREWAWFSRSGMINRESLVNDGLNAACRNNGGETYTYNQGVILGGLVDLYRIDGDRAHLAMALSIAEAAMARLTKAGVLQEPTAALNQDGQTFKGVFAYYLGDLVPLVRDAGARGRLEHFLAVNADAVWRSRQAGTNKVSAYWGDGPVLYGAAAQAAGLELFDAAYRALGEPEAGSAGESGSEMR